MAGDALARRAARVKEIESISSASLVVPSADSVMLPVTRPPDAGPETTAPPPASTSQVSSLSVSKPGLSMFPPPRRWPIAALGLVAAAAIGWAAFASLRDRGAAAPAPADEATATATEPIETARPAPSTAPSASATTEAAAPTVSGSASASASVSVPTSRPPVATGAARPTHPSAPKPAAKTGGCNPPYVIDAKGIRRIKPECL